MILCTPANHFVMHQNWTNPHHREGDFCGSGASTIVFARMFPNTDIVGIDLADKHIAVAKLRAKLHLLKNVRFILCPDQTDLPSSIGYFNYICLNAAYEHLLQDERYILLPEFWSCLKPVGLLLFNSRQTGILPWRPIRRDCP